MLKFLTPSAPEVSRFIVTFPVAQITDPVEDPFTNTVAPISPFTSTDTEFVLIYAGGAEVRVGVAGGVVSARVVEVKVSKTPPMVRVVFVAVEFVALEVWRTLTV